MVASKQGLVNVLSNYIHVGCENLTYATWYDHKVGQTKFTVYRHKDFYLNAGGQSLFRFQTNIECWKATLELRNCRGPAL